MEIRRAIADDADVACAALRRFIAEFCYADLRGDSETR